MLRRTRRKNKKKIFFLIIPIPAAVLFLLIWTMEAEGSAHAVPEYSMEDISFCVAKDTLSEQDYAFLFRQTGLGREAVDALRREGRQQELFALQKGCFAPVKVGCRPNTVISREEYLPEEEQGQSIPIVETGDILINFNCHVFGWRSGHAGIVTDAEKRLTLEAGMPGTRTAIMDLNDWERYPSFAVLRLKGATEKERTEIAEYAASNLLDVPYRISAGLWETGESLSAESGQSALSGTQCAHLVWHAFHQFGYDLDSDGGRIVTPRDIYESPLLEVVQIYGMNDFEKRGKS